MQFSNFGQKFCGSTGIGELMHDLASLDESLIKHRLGGGNPAILPAASAIFRESLQDLALSRTGFESVFCTYPPAQGYSRFIHSLVELLNSHYGWSLIPGNILLTNGSQNAFFMLFNLLAGSSSQGSQQILLPLAPEYIGYGDVAIGSPFFKSQKPLIEKLDDQLFKYRLDIDKLQIGKSISALCLSRPTNPTGNVITDAELDVLDNMALEHNIPLIIDNAYGAPFPNIIHVPATLRWHKNIILSMSLSKLGLPGARSGIIIARTEIVNALTQMNAVMNLSPACVAAGMLTPLFDSGEILSISEDIIRPFYQQRVCAALGWFRSMFDGLPALAHKPEGSIFLWIWFPELPVTCAELYQRLKKRGVVIVPGHYFFPGLDADWAHKHQCIRVNVAGDATELQSGLSVIADEVRSVMQLQP